MVKDEWLVYWLLSLLRGHGTRDEDLLLAAEVLLALSERRDLQSGMGQQGTVAAAVEAMHNA